MDLSELSEEEKESIKEILEKSLKKLNRESPFLCPNISKQRKDGLWKKDEELVLALEFLMSQKPTKKKNKRFFNHKNFDETNKRYWWKWNKDNLVPKRVLEEKRQFVVHIIKKLKV